MSFHGLASCSAAEMPNSPICIQKAVEFSCSTLLMIAVGVSLGVRVSYERQLNFYVAISAIMLLTLLFNALYTMLGNHWLYTIENLFFDAYFPTLVYKFGAKWLQKERASIAARLATLLYVLYLLLVVADFIFVIVEHLQPCQCTHIFIQSILDAEIPYLIVDASGLTLSVWLAIFGYHHTRTERQRLETMGERNLGLHSVGIVPGMRRCIVINMIAQVVGLARTIYFVSDPAMDCKFSQNATAQACISFLFLVVTYYMGMVAALLFFDQKRRSYFIWSSTQSRSSADEQKVELIDLSVLRTPAP